MDAVLDVATTECAKSIVVGTDTQSKLRTTDHDKHEFDIDTVKEAVRTILKAVGEDPNRTGLEETLRRMANMYLEMFSGLRADPARHLRVTFPETYNEMVLVRHISFNSMCEHHLLPANGVAHVAYIPNGRVTGLNKLAKVVDEVARRPKVQERMTQTVADFIENELDTAGVAVVVDAEHSCMSIRGIRKPGSRTLTSALRGVFKTNQSSRVEVIDITKSSPSRSMSSANATASRSCRKNSCL